MDLRKFKNFIFPVFFIINLNPSVLAKEFHLLNKEKKNNNNNVIWSKVSKQKKYQSSRPLFVQYKEDSIGNLSKKNLYFSDLNSKIVSSEKEGDQLEDKSYIPQNKNLIVNTKDESRPTQFRYENKKNELEIQSDSQTENNNTLFAEGNVIVSYEGKFLKADSIIYDKSDKTLAAKGDIYLVIGQQIFRMDQVEYDFDKKKGYMLDVNGIVNTTNFVDDIISNFSDSDIKKIESLLDIKKEKVLHTPGKVENWILSADKVDIEGDIWKSEKAVFTNDLLELKQAKIEINSLEATVDNEQVKFKSSLNYLILDEKIEIPFWFGKRTLTRSNKGFDTKNSWNVGYENLDKDGFFIGKKLKSANLSNFFLSLEPQFLMQRAFKGYTKSFVKKGDSTTGKKIKRETTLSDYFALNSEISGEVNSWDLRIEKQINSFDLAKFNDAFRLKTNLSKEINFLNSAWESSFYSVYRDRIWNGSLGDSEIYLGYGTKLEKQKIWEVNGIQKSEVVSFGIANLKGEALNNKNLVTSLKGNLFYSIDQKIPLIVDTNSNKLIDSSYQYVYEPVKRGLSLNTRIAFSSSLYENSKHQEYIGIGAGPELIFGNFKNKFLDYTRIGFFPLYKLKSGDSPFKFDQISDKYTIDFIFDQQLYGPLILKSNAKFNLDSDSKEYGDVINSNISLNWEKRSYDFGIFYQPHNHAGGISFSLFGFK